MRHLVRYILVLSGTLCTVLAVTASADTTRVSDTIRVNTTWTKSSSPYLMTDQLVVRYNATLTIEPGVTVLLGRDSLYITVQGRLHATGTAADSIQFKRTSTAPGQAVWQGISLQGTAVLSYCTILDANTGVTAGSNDSLVMKHCRVSSRSSAIYIGSQMRSALIDSCTFSDGEYALNVYLTKNVTISHSTLSCSLNGVDLWQSDSIKILSNTITSLKRGMGIRILNGTAQIQNNLIQGCIQGVSITYDQTDVLPPKNITHNSFRNNTTDVFLDSIYAPLTLHYNNFSGQPAVKNQSPSMVDARYNYWGPAATKQMDSLNNPKNITGIIDIFDSTIFNRVDYSSSLDTINGSPRFHSGTVELIDSNGLRVSGFREYDTVIVRVIDPDRDLDTLRADQVTVRLTSFREATPETLLLPETGLHTGIFQAPIRREFNPQPRHGDTTLQLAIRDTLRAVYTDAFDGYGNARACTTRAAAVAELVSGPLNASTTWTHALSPYLVTGDVLVDTGKTLTIESGVSVFFNARSDDRHSGQDTTRSGILVRGGTLQSVGTVTQPIVFLSNSAAPGGDWEGIDVSDGGTLRAEHCRFMHATKAIKGGVHGESRYPGRNGLVRHCWFAPMAYHIDLFVSIGWTIDSSVFDRPDYGITLDNAKSANVSHCRVNNASFAALNLINCDSTVTVRNNFLLDSSATGNGILTSGGRPRLLHNRIDGCEHGLFVFIQSYPVAIGNTITNGKTGVAMDFMTSSPLLRNNNIYGQTGRQLYNKSEENIDAQYNYWGPATTAEMISKGDSANISTFYDHFDSSALGRVDYRHWLTQPYNAPPVFTTQPPLAAEPNLPYTYQAGAEDPDNYPLVFRLTRYPAGMTIDSLSGLVQWTPDSAGVFTVELIVRDTTSQTDTQHFVITVEVPNPNSLPVLSLAFVTGTKSGDIIFNYTITDSEKDTIRLLTPAYTINNGDNWQPATFMGKTVNIGEGGYNGSLTWRSATDLRGQVRDSVRFRIIPADARTGRGDTSAVFAVRNLLGDYNHDLDIDFDDFAVFAQAWRQRDTSRELGPVTGTLPALTLIPDGVLDGKDLYTFIQTWNWAAAHPAAIAKTVFPLYTQTGFPVRMTRRNHTWVFGFDTPEKNLTIHMTITPREGRITAFAPVASLAGANAISLSRLAEGNVSGTILAAQTDNAANAGTMEIAEVQFDGTAAVTADYEARDAAGTTVSRGRRIFFTENTSVAATVSVSPHPFATALRLVYAGPHTGELTARIYSYLGEPVAGMSGRKPDNQPFILHWDGAAADGRPVPAGVYYYEISIAGTVCHGRLLKTE